MSKGIKIVFNIKKVWLYVKITKNIKIGDIIIEENITNSWIWEVISLNELMYNLDFSTLFNRLRNYDAMGYEEYKYSFIIVKPNGARHLKIYANELKRQGFDVLGFFVIYNHEEVNLSLHTTERERRNIIPINKMFKDLYGDSAILILIGQKNISYSEFVEKVYQFKWHARSLVEINYLSYVFDTSSILGINQGEVLKVIDKEGKEVKKYEMNNEGTFMVALPNSLHSPDNDVETTIQELRLMYEMGIISRQNIIPKRILDRITRYNSMEVLKDML